MFAAATAATASNIQLPFNEFVKKFFLVKMIYDCFVLLKKFRRNEMLPIISAAASSAEFHKRTNIFGIFRPLSKKAN